MQHLRPASLCSRLLLKRRPPNSKGNELVKHRDLGIMAVSLSLSLSLSLSTSLSLFLFFFPFSLLPRVWVCMSLQYIHTTRAHSCGVVDGDRKGLKWVKGSKRRVNSCIAQGSRAKASKYSIIGTSPTSLSMSNFRGPFNPFCTQQRYKKSKN